jgi:hypothetical protein
LTTISAFKSQMQGGGARPNQFRVELAFPAIVGAFGPIAGAAAQFLCKSTTLPASTVEDITAMYRGRPVHFAGERTFQPWGVSIYNDNDFLIRNAMETWSGRILNYDATNGILSPVDYQVDMRVHQLDRNDNIVKTYKFFDVYPVSVGQIALDFEANNQIEVFDVEFVYNYFTTDDI